MDPVGMLRRFCGLAAGVALILVAAEAAAQEPSPFVEIKAMAQRNVAAHAQARDFSSGLAEGGDFDAAMTQWLRDNAEFHERQMVHGETMVQAADAELLAQDPKATEPSRALNEWLADQEARAQRDQAAAQRLTSEGADGRATKAFQEARTRTSQVVASDARTFQRWQTVVVDSTGEVIVNDRDDVSEARFEDLARRQMALDRQLDTMMERARSLAPTNLGNRDAQLEGVIDELRPRGSTSEQRASELSRALLDMSQCEKRLTIALAEMKAVQARMAGCQDTVAGCNWALYEAKRAAHDQAEAECIDPGMTIARARAAAGLEITRSQMKRLGVGQSGPTDRVPGDSDTGDRPPEVEILPLTGPDQDLVELAPLVSAQSDEVELEPLTRPRAEEIDLLPLVQAGNDEVDLVPLTEPDGF